MKRSSPDTHQQTLPAGLTHASLAGMLADAGVILDGELDDLLAILLTKNKGQRLMVYTPDKDGIGFAPKAHMMRTVVGRKADYEVWMSNDYKKSAMENQRENERILRGPAGDSLRLFAKSLNPAFNKWGVVPLMITGPTFGILDRLHQWIDDRPMVVFAYTGSYNLAHMQDVVALSKCRVGGVYVVDTSAFNVLGGCNDPRFARLENLRTLFAGTTFWDDLRARQPHRFWAIRKFLLRFNTELVRPGRLFRPEHLDKITPDLEKEYEDIFCRGPTIVLVPQLAKYLEIVSTKHDLHIKHFKRTMIQGTEELMSDAPMCDLLIGLLCHLDHERDIEFIYGEWVVDRFSRVDPEGSRASALSWKLRCTRKGASDEEVATIVERITDLVRTALLED